MNIVIGIHQLGTKHITFEIEDQQFSFAITPCNDTPFYIDVKPMHDDEVRYNIALMTEDYKAFKAMLSEETSLTGLVIVSQKIPAILKIRQRSECSPEMAVATLIAINNYFK